MITLGVMKSSRDTGIVKKMLHAPTLTIYAVKEEPISNKDVRKNLKEWISLWQNHMSDSNQHIKVHGSYWNQPEGCVSILMEHLSGGSLYVSILFKNLKNLLDSVGTLPEIALKDLSQ